MYSTILIDKKRAINIIDKEEDTKITYKVYKDEKAPDTKLIDLVRRSVPEVINHFANEEDENVPLLIKIAKDRVDISIEGDVSNKYLKELVFTLANILSSEYNIKDTIIVDDFTASIKLHNEPKSEFEIII